MTCFEGEERLEEQGLQLGNEDIEDDGTDDGAGGKDELDGEKAEGVGGDVPGVHLAIGLADFGGEEAVEGAETESDGEEDEEQDPGGVWEDWNRGGEADGGEAGRRDR